MEKLLILSGGKGYGGSEKSIEMIAKRLKTDFEIVVGVANKEHEQFFKKENIDCFKLYNSKWLLICNIYIIYRYITYYNVILVNTNKDVFCIAILSYFLNLNNKNILIYVRNHAWKYRKFILKRLNKAKYILPTKSVLEKGNYLKKYINKQNIFIIGEPIEIKKRKYCRGKYLLSLANISRLKGLDLLIEAYIKSEIYKKNIKLIICGTIRDKVYFNELLNKINENKMNLMIKIEPFQNNELKKDILYKNSLMVINSSISEYGGPETFGRTIIEGWSYKKPVISFNVGGPKYIIDNGINGFLVEEKNIKELAEKISLLSNNENLCRSFGENGYNKVFLKYTVEIIIKKLLNCLEEKYN